MVEHQLPKVSDPCNSTFLNRLQGHVPQLCPKKGEKLRPLRYASGMRYSRISSAVDLFHAMCRDLEAGKFADARRTARRIAPFNDILRLVLAGGASAEEIASKVWGSCDPLRRRAVERMIEAAVRQRR